MLGFKIPKNKEGIPTHKVQGLKACPHMAGNIHPINNGNPNPISNPNSLNTFFEIEFFIISLIQTPASMFRQSLLLAAHS